MVSPVFSGWNRRLMPYRAILETDLVGMARSWVIRIWLVLMAFQSLLTIAQALEEDLAVDALANLLGTFPLIWSIFVIIVSSGAVASEAGVVADSVLSKAVTRREYIVAKFSARLLVVLALYLVVVIPAVFVIARRTESDLTTGGVMWAVLIVGLLMALLTNLAVMFSTIFNRTLVAVVVVWILWYGATGLLTLAGLETLSPALIVGNLSATLQGDYQSGDNWRTAIEFVALSSVTVLVAMRYFSQKDL